MLKKILLYCIIAFQLLFCPLSLMAESNPKSIDLAAKSGFSSSFRSFLYPGWGQFYLDQESKGYFFAITSSVSIVTAILFYNVADDSYARYVDRGSEDDGLYSDYINSMNYMYYAIGLGVATWIYSIFDAYYYGNKFEVKRDSYISNKPKVAMYMDKNRINISYCRNF